MRGPFAVVCGIALATAVSAVAASSEQLVPKVTGVEVVGHDPTKGTFDLVISGEGLGNNAGKVVIDAGGRNAVVSRKCQETGPDPGPCVQKVDTNAAGRRLDVIGFAPRTDQSSVDIRVWIDQRPAERIDVTFRAMGGRQAKVVSLAVFVGLLGLVGFVIWPVPASQGSPSALGGAKSTPEPGRAKVKRLIGAVFLDERTSSYSLSKFQLVWWIFITVYAYVYLLLTRTLVQGQLASLPPVPENLPSLLFLSGLTLLSTGVVTASVGSKGAGEIGPTRADFISSGGVVMAERLQFFLWTLIAGLAYLLILLLDDPTRVDHLPDIPDTLLYLTGVSAASYAGGKLVKGAGPVIANLAVTGDGMGSEPLLKIAIEGSGLSKDATVSIDGKTLRADGGLYSLETEPASTEEGSVNKLILRLMKPEVVAPYLAGEHKLVLRNRDGQYATAMFPRDPMRISRIDSTTSGLIVRGENLSSAQCKLRMDGTTTDIPCSVEPKGDQELNVKLEKNLSVGKHMLTLVSPMGFHVSSVIEIPNAQ